MGQLRGSFRNRILIIRISESFDFLIFEFEIFLGVIHKLDNPFFYAKTKLFVILMNENRLVNSSLRITIAEISLQKREQQSES